MKFSCYLLFIILVACDAVPNSRMQLSDYNKIQPGPLTPLMYCRLKQAVHAQQLQYKASKSPGLPAAKAYIYSTITDSIFAYWYGTAWDFNGVTQVPNEGKIACGYFVTTVLRDAGFPVARVKLAQAPASTMINTLCASKSIKRFSRLGDLKAYLAGIPDSSLLILGLDNHVGLVQHIKERNFFIDAGYAGDQVVVKELLEEAIPVKLSKSYMIGDVLANEPLIRRWMDAR